MAVLLANCSIDVSIDNITADDFLKSSVLGTSRGISDGQTGATVVVLLKNSDDSLIENYKPEITFIDNSGSSYEGNGITYWDCAASNTSGVSTCVIKSIEVGSRHVLFNNVVVELKSQVYFDAPSRNGTFLQVVSSGQIDQNANGYTVTSHTGAPFAGLKQKVNGYTVFTNTTGGITPVQ